jgi:phosphate transport system permease protein
VYVWQPISLIHKYNLIPLLAGSFKVAFIALLVATPLALGAALFVSQLAPPRWRAWIKPAIELVAGLPSIVLGFLALVLLASLLESPARAIADLLQIPVSRLNALVAGLAVGFAIVPLIFTLADDALSAVPRLQVHSALALGATRWQAALHIVTPAAAPGLLAAVTLGFGRALGETMIVLLASGNAALLTWNLFQPTRTLAATIAAEMAEAVFGGHHYRMLFLVGTLLFAVTFTINLAADLIRTRLRQRLAGLS